jgi:uncharacterized protein YfeS
MQRIMKELKLLKENFHLKKKKLNALCLSKIFIQLLKIHKYLHLDLREMNKKQRSKTNRNCLFFHSIFRDITQRKKERKNTPTASN